MLSLLLVLISLVLIAILAYVFIERDTEEVAEDRTIDLPLPEPVQEEEPAQDEPETVEEAELPLASPVEILPPLDQSDSMVLDGIKGLVAEDSLLGWIPESELVRKFVAVVDNISLGLIPRQLLGGFTPVGSFSVRRLSEQEAGVEDVDGVEGVEGVEKAIVYELDRASYQRFDESAQMIDSVDARGAAEFYMRIKPMVETAFEELGYQDKKFDDVMFRAIEILTAAPVIERPIYLLRPKIYYEFQDASLENLNAAQKQMIRMGPDNTRRIQQKLEAFRAELQQLLQKRKTPSATAN